MNRTALIAAAATLAVAAHVTADEYHNGEIGYRLTIPDGWIQIPEDVVKVVSEVSQSDRENPVIPDAVFQRKDRGAYEHPIVSVNSMWLSDFGIQFQPSKRKMLDFAQMLSGANINEIRQESFTDEFNSLYRDMKKSQTVVDTSGRRFAWVFASDVEGVGEVKSVSSGHFGRETLVIVTFHSKASEWDETAAERELALGSFRFDPDAEYQVGLTVEKQAHEMAKGDALQEFARTVIIYVILGALFTGLIVIYQTIKPKRERGEQA